MFVVDDQNMVERSHLLFLLRQEGHGWRQQDVVEKVEGECGEGMVCCC